MGGEHPLAEACRRCHDFPDAIASAHAQGERLDARMAALAALTEPTPEAKAEIWTLAQDLHHIAGQQESGALPAYWNWLRACFKIIRQEAERLFGQATWVRDLHGPQGVGP